MTPPERLGFGGLRGFLRITPGPEARACESNLGAVALAMKHYQDDHERACPRGLSELVPRYLKAILTCPAADRPGYDSRTGFLR